MLPIYVKLRCSITREGAESALGGLEMLNRAENERRLGRLLMKGPDVGFQLLRKTAVEVQLGAIQRGDKVTAWRVQTVKRMVKCVSGVDIDGIELQAIEGEMLLQSFANRKIVDEVTRRDGVEVVK